MSKYIMRLDDAASRMDVVKWNRIERLLNEYGVKPVVAVIPNCEDPDMDKYPEDDNFWETVKRWNENQWTIALHGYNHVCNLKESGINPVHNRSEFAGLPLDDQKRKIADGVKILRDKGFNPDVFIAPSHTFDENTIKALIEESDIRIISDTIANSPYSKYGMTFVPQQSGNVRKLPFKIVTFCYHPNIMEEKDFCVLEQFLKDNHRKFISFPINKSMHKENLYDIILRKMYFARRK